MLLYILCRHRCQKVTSVCTGVQDLGPDLTYVRISGYGQTGPKAKLPGYASVCEGYGGLRCSCTHHSGLCADLCAGR